jgi:hypothetical protein
VEVFSSWIDAQRSCVLQRGRKSLFVYAAPCRSAFDLAATGTSAVASTSSSRIATEALDGEMSTLGRSARSQKARRLCWLLIRSLGPDYVRV